MTEVAKTAPVVHDGIATKPGDASHTSTWSAIASGVWDSLRNELTSLKPANSGGKGSTNDGDNPNGGAGGKGAPDDGRGVVSTAGKGTTDSGSSDKPPVDDGRGVRGTGGQVITDGGAGEKPPIDDGRGLQGTGGKGIGEGDTTKKPPADDRGLEPLGGKNTGDVTKPGRRGGDDRTMPDPTSKPVGDGEIKGAPPHVPDLDPPSKNKPEPVGKGKDTEQMTKPHPNPVPFHGGRETSKYGPHPDSTPAEVPSAEDQSTAIDNVHSEEVSSAMGLDALSQKAADAIISGDFAGLQTMLKDLESKGPEGAQQLHEMAQQLGNLLGTEVRPQISDDNKFSLDVMTAFSDSRSGCFPSGTSETHLNIPSEGEMTASGSRYWNPAYPRSMSADPAVEATRFQALATRSALGVPEFLNNMNDTDFTPTDPDRLRLSE